MLLGAGDLFLIQGWGALQGGHVNQRSRPGLIGVPGGPGRGNGLNCLMELYGLAPRDITLLVLEVNWHRAYFKTFAFQI